MVKEASTYLFNATKQRFFFKAVKILIPLHWLPKPEYLSVKTESYDKADVIVANPYLKHGDDPYTLQYGGCGEKGRYIHFTPNFLLNDTFHNIYGSRAKVFVHEWAHLRWGVFDEYNNDAPFYVSVNSGNANVEATRCSADVTGKYIVPSCMGNSCMTRECKYDQQTKLYEAGCKFVPEKTQNVPASIMYMQSLPSVVEFCDQSTHNEKATNMQNKMCNYKSTWEVIMNSPDFTNTSSINSTSPPFETTFSLLQTKDRAVCLVLDVSGSMDGYNRINRLYQAAEIFLLQIIEMGSWVGIVTFQSTAQITCNLRQIVSENVRQDLIKCLPTSAGGGTKICEGVYKGFEVKENLGGIILPCTDIVIQTPSVQPLPHDTASYTSTIHTCKEKILPYTCTLRISLDVDTACVRTANIYNKVLLLIPEIFFSIQVIKQKYSNLDGSEIVLLTDGEDRTMSNCLTDVKNKGSIIHTITLGPSAAPELEQFSDMTGGLKFHATDKVDSNGLIDAFSGISSGSGNISEQPIQLESTAQSVAVKQWMNGTVTVDSTVGKDTFFVVTWDRSTSPPDILLKDPKGKEYRTSNFTVSNLNLQTARLNIAGTAEVGNWLYWIQNNHTESQVISMIVTSRAASLAVPPVTVKAHMNKDTNNFPNPMVIYAEVSQGFLPVLGATVMATIEQETGSAVELKLLDDGSGADITKNDGIYSKYFTSFKGNGRYNLKVHIQGRNQTVRLGRRQSRALYVPGYIENGEIKMNAPRPEVSDDEIQAKLGSFNRVATGGSFVVKNVPSGGITDVFPPCKITDLEAQFEEDKIHLSWTAPGNDLDVGQADRYIIKVSESFLDLRNTFENATSVNTSSLVPKPAGTKESFQFKPENVTIENGTIIYFAVRAIDNASLTSEVSNIVQAALFVPPKESLPDTLPTEVITNSVPTQGSLPDTLPTDVINDGVNVSIIVLIVTGSVIAVLIAVSITVCILHKKNRKVGPELRM
nr:calcium-activated chloride channel regulator 1-like [Chrysemys picta bellii]